MFERQRPGSFRVICLVTVREFTFGAWLDQFGVNLAQVDMLPFPTPEDSASEAEPRVEEIEVTLEAGDLATLIDRYALLSFRDRPLSEERRLLNELGERELTLLPERLEVHHVAPPPEVVGDEISTETVDLDLGVCYSWPKGYGPCKEEAADTTTGSCWGSPPRPHLCHICWGEHRSKNCDDTEAVAKF